MLEENVLISFLKKFNQYPFCVKYGLKEYNIGDGMPEFTVNFLLQSFYEKKVR